MFVKNNFFEEIDVYNITRCLSQDVYNSKEYLQHQTIFSSSLDYNNNLH